MELIGPHQVLRPLADLALDGGQQLRGDGGVQNVLQHVVEGLVALRVVPGQVPHQMPHQGLGDGGVDAVHTHVVAVVGAPAQGQLAEVAGADDDAAGGVGDVHQHLCALPGLAVFKGDRVVLHLVADVPEVAADGVRNVHGPQGGAQLLRQDDGVVFRAVGGAEAGHGDGHDVRHGPVQHLHGKAGDQHRQGGVQPAGEAHHGGLRPGVLQPLLQSQRGDQQNLPAAGVPVLLALGDEGLGGNVAGQGGVPHRQGEGDRLDIRRDIAEHLGPAALIAQLLHVDLGGVEPRLEPALLEHGAVLRDHLMGAEHHVGGGLALAGAGVDVAAQKLCGLHTDQVAAVAVLSDDVVAGGQVADDGGAGRRQVHGGGDGGPHVLADLKAQHQLRHLPAGEHQPAEGRLLPAEGHGAAVPGRGGELALLVKFAVIGQMGLGHDAQNLSFLYNYRAVIQFVFLSHRHAQRRDDLQIPGGRQDRVQSLLRAPQQGVLVEQIAAGVARQAQLRQHQHPDAGLVGLAHHGEGLLRVIVAVGQPQLRRTAGNRDETVFHGNDLLNKMF